MPAFTTIFAGLSALGGLAGVSNAQKTANEQKKRLAAQNTAAKEAAAQGAQVAGPDAEFVLGTEDAPLAGKAASDDLLKKALSKTGATKVGGIKGSPTKIGGL